jgi:Asp-tRNA(Asn)/Glu-tRNA(Gln) amidotransferase A subunit family amidase
MPTTAVPAPALRKGLVRGGQDALLLRAIGAYTPLANCTGLPAIAIPCGRDPIGRPLSIMFVGAPGSEMRLLAIAHAMEATGLADAPLDRS